MLLKMERSNEKEMGEKNQHFAMYRFVVFSVSKRL
jgi:hypothetical protein